MLLAEMEAKVQHLASNLLSSYHAGQTSEAILLLDQIEHLCTPAAKADATHLSFHHQASSSPAAGAMQADAGTGASMSVAQASAAGHTSQELSQATGGSITAASAPGQPGSPVNDSAQSQSAQASSSRPADAASGLMAPALLLKLAVNIRDPEGNTLLHVAANRGDAVFLKRLLACGAWHGATARPVDNTPLHVAALRGHVHAVKALLDAGAQVDAHNSGYNTPLTVACGAGHVGVALQLLKAGASLMQDTRSDITPLMAAAANGHTLVVQALLRSAANSASHSSMPAGSSSTTTTTLQVGTAGVNEEHAGASGVRAMLRCMNTAGNTALHFAARAGHLDVVKLLVEAGADVTCRNNAGRSPLVEARLASSQQCYDYLHDRWLASCPAAPSDGPLTAPSACNASSDSVDAHDTQGTGQVATDTQALLPITDETAAAGMQHTINERGATAVDTPVAVDLMGQGTAEAEEVKDSGVVGSAGDGKAIVAADASSTQPVLAQQQHGNVMATCQTDAAVVRSDAHQPQDEWMTVGKGQRHATASVGQAQARRSQAGKVQPGFNRHSGPAHNAQEHSRSGGNWRPAGAVSQQQDVHPAGTASGNGHTQHAEDHEDSTSDKTVRPTRPAGSYKNAAAAQLPRHHPQHPPQPQRQSPRNPSASSSATASASSSAESASLGKTRPQPGLIAKPTPPGFCSPQVEQKQAEISSAVSNQPGQASSNPSSNDPPSTPAACHASPTQGAMPLTTQGASVGMSGTGQQPFMASEQQAAAQDAPAVLQEAGGNIDDIWVQAMALLEEACPAAAALDILPQHVCGVGIDQLSYSQLEALEAVHHVALARLVEAKVTLARQQERARIAEVALRRMQVEQRRAQMVVDAAHALERSS